MVQVVFATLVLGFAARRSGDLDEAQRHLDRLRDVARSPGEAILYLPMVLTELGYVAELRGNTADALAMHVEALDLAVEHDRPRDTAPPIEGSAAALADAGDVKQAARLLGAAAEHRRTTKLPASQSEQLDIDRAAHRCVDALGTDGYTAAVESGATMTPGDVLRALRVHSGRR